MLFAYFFRRHAALARCFFAMATPRFRFAADVPMPFSLLSPFR